MVKTITGGGMCCDGGGAGHIWNVVYGCSSGTKANGWISPSETSSTNSANATISEGVDTVNGGVTRKTARADVKWIITSGNVCYRISSKISESCDELIAENNCRISITSTTRNATGWGRFCGRRLKLYEITMISAGQPAGMGNNDKREDTHIYSGD